MPALLVSLALGLLAAPAASAAPATCTLDPSAAGAGPTSALGQDFTVGAAGGDLHAYAVAASSPDGASTLSIVPLDATGNPDPTAPLVSTQVNLPADPDPTTVTFPKPVRLAQGTYVVLMTPDTQASWVFCSADTATGGAWLHSGKNWLRSADASFALGLDLQPQDLTPPALSVTPPASPTRAPHVEFVSDDPDATFTCSVDGGAAAACDSPFEPAGLADGPHHVRVVARDVMDNASAPATASFVVDTAPPSATVAIDAGNAADHTVHATVKLSEPGTFTCALDGAAVACAAFTPATEGSHTLTVSATDTVGNTGDTPAPFTSDWTSPVVDPVDDIEVTAAPGGDDDSASRTRPGTVVDFDVTANDNLDPAPTVTCDPESGSFFGLGTTTVTCTAHDAAGNPSAPITFKVSVLPPPPDAADIDIAYDPAEDALDLTETHGGDVAWQSRRLLLATAGDHTTRASIRRVGSVADQDDLDRGLRLSSLRYDDGPRLRLAKNGYGYRSTERHDGSLKRLVIAARAGRRAVVVKYSAGSDRSEIRYLRSGRTLRVVRVDGLAIPHLRTEAGAVVIDLAGGG